MNHGVMAGRNTSRRSFLKTSTLLMGVSPLSGSLPQAKPRQQALRIPRIPPGKTMMTSAPVKPLHWWRWAPAQSDNLH